MKYNCRKVFMSLKSTIIQEPFLIFADLKSSSRGHMNASQFVVREVSTNLDENERDQDIVTFPDNQSLTKQNYTENEGALLALVKFLERLWCYFNCLIFEVIICNQDLDSFSANQS